MIKRNRCIKLEKDEFLVNAEIYTNINDMLADLKGRKPFELYFANMEKEKLMLDWHGVKSYKEALSLLDNGYDLAMLEMKKEINIKASRYVCGQQKRYSFHNDVVGFQPIVPLALQNIPTSMVNFSVKKVKSKVIDIYYEMAYPWNVAATEIVRIGVNLIKWIYQLEMQGYRVNLYSVETFTDSSSADVLCVKVKDSNRPLDIRRISFPIAHVAFFRVLAFDWYSKFPLSKWRERYGYALYTKKEYEHAQRIIKGIFGRNAIYIPGAMINKKGFGCIPQLLEKMK